MDQPEKPVKRVSQRRSNRMCAVQFLYQWELNRPDQLHDAVRVFLESKEEPREYFEFAEELIHGAIEHMDAVDAAIAEYTVNWSFDRIAKVDLSVLRLAIYELQQRRDIPPIVSINEAIELGKIFSTSDSKRFINGILDKMKNNLDRPLRQAAD